MSTTTTAIPRRLFASPLLLGAALPTAHRAYARVSFSAHRGEVTASSGGRGGAGWGSGRLAGSRRAGGDVGQQVAADRVGGMVEVVEPAQVAGVGKHLELRVG